MVDNTPSQNNNTPYTQDLDPIRQFVAVGYGLIEDTHKNANIIRERLKLRPIEGVGKYMTLQHSEENLFKMLNGDAAAPNHYAPLEPRTIRAINHEFNKMRHKLLRLSITNDSVKYSVRNFRRDCGYDFRKFTDFKDCMVEIYNFPDTAAPLTTQDLGRFCDAVDKTMGKRYDYIINHSHQYLSNIAGIVGQLDAEPSVMPPEEVLQMIVKDVLALPVDGFQKKYFYAHLKQAMEAMDLPEDEQNKLKNMFRVRGFLFIDKNHPQALNYDFTAQATPAPPHILPVQERVAQVQANAHQKNTENPLNMLQNQMRQHEA